MKRRKVYEEISGNGVGINNGIRHYGLFRGNSSQTESTGPSVGTEAASSTEAGKSEETPAQADGDVETKELKVSHVFAESHPVHQAFLQASDELYDKTGGRYKLVIYPNGTYGNYTDSITACQMGDSGYRMSGQCVRLAGSRRRAVCAILL